MIASIILASTTVLSKIEFFDAPGRPDISAERSHLEKVLRRYLQSDDPNVSLAPVPEGTLGVCFQAEIAGKQRFLKSHLRGSRARASLEKEADILLRLHGNAIVLDRFDLPMPDGTFRLCLLMPVLAPLRVPMRPEEAATILSEHSRRLEAFRPENLVTLWNFGQYLACAHRAIEGLSDRGLLEPGSAADLRLLIARLQDRIGSQPRGLCHGDFGPKNIMLRGAQPVVIDWEDAFWGIAGYDYLYWLTFMENRSFLRQASFGRTGLEPQMERSILALVVLLKCFLAVQSGAYLNHVVSIQARIAEILELPEQV